MIDKVTLTLTRKQAIVVARIMGGSEARELSPPDYRAYCAAKKTIETVLLNVGVSRMTCRYLKSVEA